MNSKTKTILRHTLIPIGFGILVGGISTLFLNFEHFFSWKILLRQCIYSIILSYVFWRGNSFIIKKINKRFSWVKETRKILIAHLILVFTYNILVIFIFYSYVWFVLMHKTDMHHFLGSFKGGFYMCLSITAILTLISYSYNFLKEWKKSVIREEQLKRESITLQYEALKNQVNPHFLFNSLNVLIPLIETDTIASVNYVKQLSDVMRYVLDKTSTELVPFTTELKFIESFNYLLNIRFGDNFRFSVNVANQNFHIVPVTLQILVENAVKHNEVSSENPLILEITDNEEYLFVKNNVQLRNSLPDSNQIGLKSLQYQYEVLSGKKLDIQNDGKVFTVKIPKISAIA